MLDTCPCGGTLELVDQTGRMFEYRGRLYQAPDGMKMRTCRGCGHEWMGSAEVEKLGEHLDGLRRLEMAREMWPSTMKFHADWMKNLMDRSVSCPPTPDTKDD